MNYEQDIKIDDQFLEIGCLGQAERMLQYTKHQAETQKIQDNAEEKLELMRAELDKAIRDNPEKYGITKITETVVTNTILIDPKYRELNQEYINAKFENNVAKGVVKAFDQRKDMLETLTKLYGQSYFAGPSTPHDLKLIIKRESNKPPISRTH